MNLFWFAARTFGITMHGGLADVAVLAVIATIAAVPQALVLHRHATHGGVWLLTRPINVAAVRGADEVSAALVPSLYTQWWFRLATTSLRAATGAIVDALGLLRAIDAERETQRPPVRIPAPLESRAAAFRTALIALTLTTGSVLIFGVGPALLPGGPVAGAWSEARRAFVVCVPYLLAIVLVFRVGTRAQGLSLAIGTAAAVLMQFTVPLAWSSLLLAVVSVRPGAILTVASAALAVQLVLVVSAWRAIGAHRSNTLRLAPVLAPSLYLPLALGALRAYGAP